MGHFDTHPPRPTFKGFFRIYKRMNKIKECSKYCLNRNETLNSIYDNDNDFLKEIEDLRFGHENSMRAIYISILILGF